MRRTLDNADGNAMRWLRNVYALLVLASVVYCGCLFRGLDHWGRGDWDQFSFRYETPRRAMLTYGQLPLWNPYVNGGNVLLAHPHCPAFSPWYLPTLLLGAPLGTRVSVVLFVALGATGMAALLRHWGLSPGACLTGGILLMMSAHFTLHITEGHLEWCVLGLIPWLLLCLVRAEHNWRLAVLGGLLLASGLLYGSVYIVVVFVPLLALWAALEAVRARSWRIPLAAAVVFGSAFLLSAVVLFPRIEFLRANPRKTRHDEQVSPAALGRMFLDPGQAEMFRHTRDIRNPPDGQLDRLLPSDSHCFARPPDTLRWTRLELMLQTTSDWSFVAFQDFPYHLFPGEPDPQDKTPARLNVLPLTTERLGIENPQFDGSEQTVRGTLYARLPDEGDLRFVVTRGSSGTTRLVVTRADQVLLDVDHSILDPADLENTRTYIVARDKVLAQQQPQPPTDPGEWYRVEAQLRTTATWCDLQAVNAPCVFQIDRWENRRGTEDRPSLSTLALASTLPGKTEAVLDATLYFRRPPDDDLRLAILQGREGTSTLTLKDPQGNPLATQRTETVEPDSEQTFNYLLPRQSLANQLQPVPMPFRWQLDRWGMWHGWHEYGCYVTWPGLAVALLGLIVSIRRHWPLVVGGMLAGLIALGAALPLSFWALLKHLPMFGSLQVPSRFLAAVIFLIAVCGACGVDRLGDWGQKIGGRWLRILVVGGIGLAIYVELTLLGWNLFGGIFACKPHGVPPQPQFAQRFHDDYQIRHPNMYSALYPYLKADSGVLEGYENIAVSRGEVRITGDPDYRGEAYLADSHGSAEITHWSMSRVSISLEVGSPDRLVLNQNYFPGWKALRRDAQGTTERLAVQQGPDGLVSIDVQPADRQVEFYYLPDSFLRGALVSALTLIGCLVLLLLRRIRKSTSRPSTSPTPV